jgi:hypothetical protein
MQKFSFVILVMILTGIGCASPQPEPGPADAFPHPAYTTLPYNGGFVHETPNQVKDEDSTLTTPYNNYVANDDEATKRRSIKGHCDIADQGTLMPCTPLIFKVLDQGKKIISEMRISKTNGDFVFYVPSQQGYRLHLQSEDYLAHYRPKGLIYPGRSVRIRVTPKKKSEKTPSS